MLSRFKGIFIQEVRKELEVHHLRTNDLYQRLFATEILHLEKSNVVSRVDEGLTSEESPGKYVGRGYSFGVSRPEEAQ